MLSRRIVKTDRGFELVLTKIILCIFLYAFVSLEIGCVKKAEPEDYLIKVRDRKITLSAFNQTVEARMEEAFPGYGRAGG